MDQVPIVNEAKYRHELKYIIDIFQLEIIQNTISQVISPDPYIHPEGNGIYEVRSVYFDDYCNSCFFENENGADPRQKFRIRIYNHSDSVINLELKKKQSGKTLKQSCRIDRNTAENILNGCLDWSECTHPVLRKFYLWSETKLAAPKVIVEYDRIPYIAPEGNVRITFDTNIRSSTDISDFFEPSICSRPIMPSGKHLLEVKFDEFLPDYVKNSISSENLKQTAFSKYYLCRKFGGII